MWFPKGCKRCGGDLYKTTDDDQNEILNCLQCGREFIVSLRQLITRDHEVEETLLAS